MPHEEHRAHRPRAQCVQASASDVVTIRSNGRGNGRKTLAARRRGRRAAHVRDGCDAQRPVWIVGDVDVGQHLEHPGIRVQHLGLDVAREVLPDHARSGSRTTPTRRRISPADHRVTVEERRVVEERPSLEDRAPVSQQQIRVEQRRMVRRVLVRRGTPTSMRETLRRRNAP